MIGAGTVAVGSGAFFEMLQARLTNMGNARAMNNKDFVFRDMRSSLGTVRLLGEIWLKFVGRIPLTYLEGTAELRKRKALYGAEGVEPSRYHYRRILSPLRLPIPPPPQCDVLKPILPLS